MVFSWRDWLNPIPSKRHIHESRVKDQLEDIRSALNDLLPLEIPSQENEESYSKLCHCFQLERWDCGIACLLMIQRFLLSPKPCIEYTSQMTPEEVSFREILLEDIGSSIWTADIVLQIHKWLHNNQHTTKAKYLFSSKRLSVARGYEELSYYKQAFASDEERVNKVFAELKRLQSSSLFRVERLPIPMIVNAICHSNCIALVLLDNSILNIETSDNNKSNQYVGHYVLLCGISRKQEHLDFANSWGGTFCEDYCLVFMNVSTSL